MIGAVVSARAHSRSFDQLAYGCRDPVRREAPSAEEGLEPPARHGGLERRHLIPAAPRHTYQQVMLRHSLVRHGLAHRGGSRGRVDAALPDLRFQPPYATWSEPKPIEGESQRVIAVIEVAIGNALRHGGVDNRRFVSPSAKIALQLETTARSEREKAQRSTNCFLAPRGILKRGEFGHLESAARMEVVASDGGG